MSYNKFDFTENYDFSKEMNERSQFSNKGIVIGEVELGDKFYAELVKDGGVSGLTDRITVWLCHREHKEKIYAFTMMVGYMVDAKNIAMQNTVKMKFVTNYANLKKTYSKKYCSVQ